jgi:hypothetical protein
VRSTSAALALDVTAERKDDLHDTFCYGIALALAATRAKTIGRRGAKGAPMKSLLILAGAIAIFGVRASLDIEMAENFACK